MPGEKLVIVNRSFWPVYPVVGEALLRFAEQAAANNVSVSVILQDHADIRSRLAEENRGKGVRFFPVKAWTSSSSSVLARIADAIFFMLWVLCTLLRLRPNKVYVSTDPPVVVPFIVMVYCKIFRADYIYHLQDIHPEAADVVVPVQRWIFKLLRWADVLVMKNATQLITITEQMAEYIRVRSSTRAPIHVLENPAVSFDSIELKKTKLPGFSFCGNAGRLQRIPLLIDAIEKYLSSGGSLKFAFAGGGVYSGQLRALSERYVNVDYHGLVSARDAAQINVDYEWAILPIADEVTQFAFPSKSSSYVFSGAKILAISGRETSVSRWVLDNNLGVAVPPDIDAVVSAFQEVERSNYASLNIDMERVRLKKTLHFDSFIFRLGSIVLGCGYGA
ncbi:glycosyltransferase [Ectopseudomonas alcaliphila]|uniref:Glycosyltransferase n=1 Tax=Ectopseudomonas alcaliphila TaxID=101564 RepID=A0A1G6SZH4_9GAMM|nr:glycosyltransferase [Pseudomonas alcaliphila]MDX5991174.1 glycosyltransferase [Pseudomonas alcaliphila]SDD22380.1 Glycosyltransferase involved in cell wall bisynthesis [Pseudomonas alcaliphila]